jgi:aerobic carbon-monoxide dehydrogenase large subunit
MTPVTKDHRLLTGRGQYVHDISLPGMLHAVFVRSVHAHAKLQRVDLAPAETCQGVVAALGAAHLGGYNMPAINPLLPDTHAPKSPLLAGDQVNSVSQPIAVVIAHSLQAAHDAAELVVVDYTAQAAIADFDPKADHVAVVLHQTGGDPSTSTPGAPGLHKVRVQHRQPRVVAMSLEPRAAVAQWHAASGEITLWLPTQTPARAQADVARVLNLPLQKVRVIAPDVGGAFGAKASVCPEDLVIALVAQRLQATVKWTSSRSDEFTSGTQGRGALLQGELWLDDAGRFVHLHARLQYPLGAWLPFSAVVPARNTARILPGPYQVASVDIEARASMSHAAAVNIYRGAGRPEAALLMERLVEKAARQARIDPVELRLRNLIPASAMPFITPTGEQLDAGDYSAALQKACARFDYAGERAAQSRRRAAGELLGIGIAMYIEPCGQGWESARVTLQADGRVQVASGSASQGQGHETSYATIAAEVLGCDASAVTVVEGDTATCPAGTGALASRSMAIGGSAVAQAAKMAAQRRAAGEPLPIVADAVYTAPAEAWSYGCVIARMAIDRDTGVPKIERIVWVDDAGRIVSPELAHGQLMGGLAQGLGQAMMEQIVYNDEGQPITGSLMDYAVPRADDMPPVEIESMAMPTKANLLGAKGVGEAGCIGVPAALLNAASDALSPLSEVGGEIDLDFPLTSERLWRAIQQAALG